MTRFSVVEICFVGVVSSTLVGCGDGETRVAKSSDANGGAQARGGEAGTAPGGSSSTDTGGRGGSAGLGGNAIVAGAGAGNAGTLSGGQAGATTAAGGAGLAGSGAGGATVVGGQAGAAGAQVASCKASFVAPFAGATLTEANDASGGLCADGFFYDVIVATDAPDGAAATLTVGTGAAIVATVQNAVARFPLAQMGTSGTQALSVSIAASGSLLGCSAAESVTVDCLGHSQCNITSPALTPTHVALNGVPVAQGGDRVSSEGSPYQAAFHVTTDIEDGQPVALTVSDGTTPTTVYSVAMSGIAHFPGVTFATDGSYTATASCQSRSGAKATSTPLTVPVDTTGPSLAVTKGTGAGAATLSSLSDGDHFGPGDDADAAAGLQLRICGTTTASDALGLDAAAFGALANNFCVSTGGNAPLCAPALASTGNGACVNFPCPGNGAFELTVVLKDRAQNSNPASPAPLKRTWSNITCAATNPTVTFIDPVADTAFTDPSLRILANGNSTAARRDKNGTTPGAQYDVVACTSAPPGSSAVLRVGRESETVALIAETTVTAATGVCPVGSQGLISFKDVTLPESLTDATFQLSHPTQLDIEVTDLNYGHTTATANVWVDSIPPTLTLNSPIGFCGSYIASAATVTRNLVFGSPIASAQNPLNLVVINPDGTQTTTAGTTLTFSQATISGVAFAVGTSSITASVVEPSGNMGVLGGSCSVQVGSNPPPTVTWVSPTAANDLGAVGNTQVGIVADADAATPGWQGTLSACTSLTGAAAAGMTVTFAANGTPIGTALNIDQTTGCVTLNSATVPEGAAVQLTATTSAGASSPGSAALNLAVDATPPSAPTNLVVTVADRRQTRFHLAWTAGADGSGPAAGYDVRVSRSATAITDANFGAAEAIPYTGTPAGGGQTDGIDVRDRYIENDYQFAIRAYDSVGNVSPILASTAPTRATYTLQTIPSPSTAEQNFGWVVDGSGDVNGDGFSDLLVGQGFGLEAYVYFGSASGVATTPSVRIQGTVGQTGFASAIIGDVTGDGIDDLAIGVFRDGDGKVLVYNGRRTWPTAALTPTNANSVITGDRSLDAGYTNSNLGNSIGRIGDFNGDGIDDFAVGMVAYNLTDRQGQIAVIPGKAGGLPPTIVLPTAFGVSAIRINGDPVIQGGLGTSIVGIGRFGGSTAPFSFVAAANLANVAAGNSAGRLYAFSGVSGIPAQIPLTNAWATYDGVASQLLGFAGATLVGDIGPGAQMAIGVQMPNYQSPGRALFLSGSSSGGPFTSAGQIGTSETPASSNGFGRLIIGGAIPGKATPLSFMGTSKADFAVSTKVGAGPRLFIIDGTKFATGGALGSGEALADIKLAMPEGFTDFGRSNRALRDVDGDGYADFAVGDVSYVSGAPAVGRVLVYR